MFIGERHFEKNLNLLREHHPRAWQEVMNYTAEPLGELFSSTNGQVNLMVRNDNGEELPLHDCEDPERELDRYYQLVPPDATGVVVFIGMGLGYTPLALIEKRSHIRHLAIFEPEIGIFMQALKALDLALLLGDRRVMISLGSDAVTEAMRPLSLAMRLEHSYILVHQPSFLFKHGLYQVLHDQVFGLANNANVGGATASAFGRHFVENRLRNMSSIHHQQLLENLADLFAGTPAVIVAGGPSLDKNADLLTKAKGKAIILAVDSALPTLLAHGVVPDFTTAIDMEDVVFEKVADVATLAEETSLVCAAWVSPLLPKNFMARQVYWAFAGVNMEKWLNKMVGGRKLTGGSSTVAHLNFIVAVLLGCDPIIFMGQDLAYSNNQDHAHYTALTTGKEKDVQLGQDEIHWVEGYGGVTVATTRSYLGMKNHFEQMMKSLPARVFVNATEGGVRLEGTLEMTMQEAISHYCEREIDVATIVNGADGRSKIAGRRRMLDELGRSLKSITGLEKDMGRLDSLIERSRGEIAALDHQQAITAFAALPRSLQRDFMELDTLNNRLDKSMVWEILDEVTMEGLRQSERLNHEIHALAGRPDHYLAWLDKSIARFQLISQCRRQAFTPFRANVKSLLERLQQENILLLRLAKEQKKGKGQENLMALLHLYYEYGDHVLLQKTLSAHAVKLPESAEIMFYRGVIAAYHAKFEQAADCFERAITLDGAIDESVRECRQRLAAQYLGFYREWLPRDPLVAMRLLFKGCRYSLDYQLLRDALLAEMAHLVEDVEIASRQGDLLTMKALLAIWAQELLGHPGLRDMIGSDNAAKLYHLYGRALIAEQQYQQALPVFTAAVELAPQDPELHRLLSGTAFALNDWPAGTASLDRAVALDPSYADYWVAMGDNLVAAGQSEKAISAYEKGLLAQPEKIALIKKIGDCYLTIDQLEAANRAYRFWREKGGGG